MSIDIKAPTFPESVADGTIAVWHKQAGEAVSRDEPLVDIETDKVTLEVVAPANGVVGEILKQEGDTVLSDEVVGKLEEGEAPAKEGGEKAEKAEAGKEADKEKEAEKKATEPRRDTGDEKAKSGAEDGSEVKLSPAARKLVDEKNLDAAAIEPTGKGGLVTKEDVLNHLKQPAAEKEQPAPAARQVEEPVAAAGQREEKRVPMTRLRKRIAERLLEATQTTAMLTTFNEVNMRPIMDLRQQYKDLFEKTHSGVRLGFMGFFVKAACEALKRFPGVNASIDGDDIVYHGYQDIGVAVSTDKGLVVPVLRDADQMGLAQIEDKVRDYGQRARDGKLGIEEIQGGTFTITNGGVFGSLLSTPILNPPQTAILGMHKIQERPMAIDGEVVVLPMMYLALSYDHRLVDGKEAVQFLVTIKELVEDPARILLEV